MSFVKGVPSEAHRTRPKAGAATLAGEEGEGGKERKEERERIENKPEEECREMLHFVPFRSKSADVGPCLTDAFTKMQRLVPWKILVNQ